MQTTRSVPLFDARCSQCGAMFAHPSLGDAVYGELLLCSVDGRQHAIVEGFSAVPAQVAALLADDPHTALWPVLAALADPPAGASWSVALHCPYCGQPDPAFQEGARCGMVEVPVARFTRCATGDLAAQVARLVDSLR
ncbi:hypothetical protein [Stenotrophomonas sp. HMWF003]|uniref:hypothetical protein n=1 Tax=Stenotrophomonas sp. HMWF003 TaxID=2056840 RepID=UPI000D4346C3|nr:hypothetical protein [Stenotrophomonas sp. HMWF003]PTT63757.1 hypothetical protein DBR34_06095 [Stenotrophomonas sp. HMWF003]